LAESAGITRFFILFKTFQGKKAGRLVAVGPLNLPVIRLFVEVIILECRQKHITRVDILGFESEMVLFPNILDKARTKGIDLAMNIFHEMCFAGGRWKKSGGAS